MSVLVTVAGPWASLDLELDADCPVASLLPELASAFGVPGVTGLRLPDGTALDAETTLASAGVLDGHRLVLTGGSSSTPSEAATGTGAGDALACYVAVDTSDSIPGRALDALSVELGRLVDALRDDPRVAPRCRLAVLTFDVEARLVLPLTPVTALSDAPRVAATRPGTDYASVFRVLRRQIDEDLEGLVMAGLRPLRPAVIVITDGRPTRGYWPPAHAALTDPGWAGSADILAFGVAGASALTVRRIGTAGAFLTAPPRLVPPVMSFVLDVLGQPARPAGGVGAAPISDPPRGWRSLDELVR
jgi:uncharacterized protein YegL